MNNYKLWINGEAVDAAALLGVINPATETVFATVSRSDEALANAAVQAAKNAQDAWAALGIEKRRGYLVKVADAFHARAGELSKLLTLEQGKPLADAEFEVAWAESLLRDFAQLDLPVETVTDNDQKKVQLHRVPLGVVACITPWNFPLTILAFKLPMALLAGNTVVVKPAPTTPITTTVVAEICAGILPSGVVNTVIDDNDLGAYLTQHPDIAKISFTGSTATGKRIMVSAADTLKRLTLELGGNDAAIVLPDVNIKTVAAHIFQLAFMNCGQVCMAIKRVYAHEAIYDELCEALARHADAAIVGNGLDEGVQFGPVNNAQQYQKVLALIASARETGRLISGAAAVPDKGYFIRPTIVRDINDGAPLVDLEQFGPVLPVISYNDIDSAIASANGLDVGLGGSVWAGNVEHGAAIAARLECGTAWVNTHVDVDSATPFCGAKQSGVGVESAQEGLHEFTQVKVINISKAEVA